MADTIITHADVITVNDQNEILADHAIAIAGNRIEAIGPSVELEAQHPRAKRIEAAGKAALPGLVNSHTHLSMTMTRSLADDLEAPHWLPIIWAIEKNLEPDTVYAGAMLGVAEMIASGTTTFNDHYFHMSEVGRAVEQTGLRADLAEAILENRKRKRGQEALARGVAFAQEWHGKGNGRIRTRMGPHALYSCSTQLIQQACAAAESLGIGVHMHVAESEFEMKLVGKDKAGETSIQHLHGLGLLGPHFIIAHGLTADDRDLEILRQVGTGIAHCPQAYAHVGGWPFPSVDQWLAAGIHVGLGTDGAASNNDLDLFDEMRFATLVRKLFARDGRVLPAEQVLRMATIEGAHLLGLAEEIGSLEVGKKADLILVDTRQPHFYPYHNLPAHLVYSAGGADVDLVMVDGQVLLEDGRFTTFDLDEVLDRAQREFEAYLKRAGWQPTLKAPEQGRLAALRLKATQQSLKVMQVLTGQSESAG